MLKVETPQTNLAEKEEEAEEEKPVVRLRLAELRLRSACVPCSLSCAAQKAASGKKTPAEKSKGKAGADSGVASEPSAPLDPVAEKLRLQRLQEASDFESARAAFGGSSKNLDELCPKTEAARAAFVSRYPRLTRRRAGLHGVRRRALLQVHATARGAQPP